MTRNGKYQSYHADFLVHRVKSVLLRKNRGSNCSGIIGFTVAALLANYVEVDFGSIIAVVAQNPYLKNTKRKI